MGQKWSNVFGFKNHKPNILVTGLDAAGKTTLLQQIATYQDTIVRIGTSVDIYQTFQCRFLSFYICSEEFRWKCLYHEFLQQISGIIFMIDGHDQIRMTSEDSSKIFLVKPSFERLLQETSLASLPLLIIINKSDFPDVISIEEVIQCLELHKLQDRKWHIVSISALNKESCQECIIWLMNKVFDTIK